MNKQENNEQQYQPSLFEKLLPLLDDWHLIELKIAQLKAKGGKGKIALNNKAKSKEAAMRQIIDDNQN